MANASSVDRVGERSLPKTPCAATLSPGKYARLLTTCGHIKHGEMDREDGVVWTVGIDSARMLSKGSGKKMALKLLKW